MKPVSKLIPHGCLVLLLCFMTMAAANQACADELWYCPDPSQDIQGTGCGADGDGVYSYCAGETGVLLHVYSCNAQNDNCDSQPGLCNVMTKSVAIGTEVLCCKAWVCGSNVANRDNPDCTFSGWCIEEFPAQTPEVLNRKCNGDPCIGRVPEVIPPTEPVMPNPVGSGNGGIKPPKPAPIEAN